MSYPGELPGIALIGRAGAGKSTVARILCERFDCGYQTFSLAAPLKDMAARLWGTEARTDRDKLQRLGVAVRDIHEDTWVELLLRTLDHATQRARPGAPGWFEVSHTVVRPVVDDCRFPNEHAALKAAGFVFVKVLADKAARIERLRRNGKLQDEAQLEHVSETALDYIETDYRIANHAFTTPDDLVAQVETILKAVRR